ncbi:glycosyltransferase family 4 protein [Paenibacillus alginolyticus]|uniref:Glycosyltransferase family 4 protein n=1 Tax=Paenibacillus alginolyticus TaxID=59839 RepID=A0ABT4G8S0_9BACL|nr:glycosyltransferase family 4 protein [Paenibacillus alginolyticus]MCY9692569.1 glycosyltransferase family 4 protein [Paenibacillus alginolyticus]MEC0143775.1 glycosyltransferase family 4 protein [Paenibacillus alginolyticus]
MRITLLCHYFYPEIGAPSARLFEMAKTWVEMGHDVEVITCFPNHPTGNIPEQYKGMLRKKEYLEGITVYRNYVYATPNEGFLKKTLGHLSFMVSSILLSTFSIKKTDVVIVSSPTLFSVLSGYVIALLRRAPFIFEVRDLWPDAIIKLGVLKNKFIIKVLEGMEYFFYKKSKKIVVVTQAFKKLIAARGIEPSKIDVITNGVDLELFNKHLAYENKEDLINKYGWENKKILLYVGAHGISQGLSTLLDVANKLKEHEELRFVFIGEGAEKKRLQALADDMQLTNVQFINGQAKEMIPLFYSCAFLSFVILRDLPMFEGYIPSKMFEIMGSGCPIVAALSGEAADILRESEGAIVVPPENVEMIAGAVTELVNDKEKREIMSSKGFSYVEQNYSRHKLASRYLDIMHDVVKEKKQ